MQTELSPSMYKQLQGKDITEEDLLTMNLIEEEEEEEDDPIGDQERSREQDVEEHHCRQPPTAEAGNQNETIINTRDSESSSPILPQQQHQSIISSHSNTTTSSSPEMIIISPPPPPPSLPPILLPREIMDDELNKITGEPLDEVNNEEMGAAPTTPSSSHHEMIIIRSPPPSSPPSPPSPPPPPSLPPILLPLKIIDDELNKVTEAPLGRVNNEEMAAAPTTPSSSDHGMILSSPLPQEPHLRPSSLSPPLVVLSPKIIIRQLNNSGDTPSRTDSESDENNNNIDADIDNHPPHHLHVKKVKEIRSRVKERQKSNAFKMLSQSSSDVTPISLYDAVNVIIPKADRESKMGMRTISGIVIEIDHRRDLYRVATKFGTIDQYLSRTDFDKCVDRIIPNQINKSETTYRSNEMKERAG
nr:formin-like protein 13 [Procambarus clarkii]